MEAQVSLRVGSSLLRSSIGIMVLDVASILRKGPTCGRCNLVSQSEHYIAQPSLCWLFKVDATIKSTIGEPCVIHGI